MKKSILLSSLLISSAMASEEKAPEQLSNKINISQKKTVASLAENKKWLQMFFKNIIENREVPDHFYAQYISKNYTQHVDGKVINYEDFINHMKIQKQSVKSVKVIFHDMIAEGDKVTTFHTAYALKKNNQPVEMQVIAIFEIKDGKLISCNELTRLVKGDSSDQDLGSRH